MLNLRIARGPLSAPENESILAQYNALTSSRIPYHEFIRWVQQSPAGPAWHGILKTEDGEIAGHTCLLPFPGCFEGKQIVAAKAEYSFVSQSFQVAKVRGFETSAQPKFILLTDQLFRHCRAEGWELFLMWPPPPMLRFAGSVGCSVVGFPFTECLLILRPWDAARRTPNLNAGQRSLLGLTGVLQQPWAIASRTFSRGTKSDVTAAGIHGTTNGNHLTFFEDPKSYKWRYFPEQYETLKCDGECPGWMTVKRGFPDRYLRVCQHHISLDQPSFRSVAKIVEMARTDEALGVRWAVYGSDESASALVGRLRKLGFLCLKRTRKLMVYASRPDLLAPSNWNLPDSMFCFDP
jgi:hypothetical protein